MQGWVLRYIHADIAILLISIYPQLLFLKWLTYMPIKKRWTVSI